MTPEPTEPARMTRLRSLRESVDRIEEAATRNQEAEVLTAVNHAASDVYALWSRYGVRGRRQVPWAGSDPERQNLVGLVFARGEAEHQGAHLGMAVGYGEAPYGMGPYGGGWLWRPIESRPGYEGSKALYDELVLWQPLHIPLRRALQWFEVNEATDAAPR